MVKRRRGASRLGCLLSVVLFGVLLYLGLRVGKVYFRYYEYRDAMKQEVRFRTSQTDVQITTRLQAIADSLGLPEEAGDVTVTRSGGQITVEAQYVEVVDLRVTRRVIRFEPRATGTY